MSTLNVSNIVGNINASSLSVTGTNGVDFNPGSDVDADLLTVGVTGAPRLYWDESLSAFRATETFVTDNDLRVVGGYVKIGEQAAAQADTAGYGQLWVRADAPNTLMFTDDAGNDDVVLLSGKIVEETGTMPSGTTPAIDPANGTVQEWTLSGNSSPTDSLVDGEFVELLIQDGTAYTITWPTITWLTDDGTAPTLKTSGVTPVLVQKVGSTLYGRRTGDGG